MLKLQEFSSGARKEESIGAAARLIYNGSDWRLPFQVKSSNFEIWVNKGTFPSHIRMLASCLIMDHATVWRSKKSQVKAELNLLLRRLRVTSDANVMTLNFELTDLKMPKEEKYRFDNILMLCACLSLRLLYKIPISVQSKLPGPKWNALLNPIMWTPKLF